MCTRSGAWLMKINATLKIWEPSAYLRKGISARTFNDVSKLLNAIRSASLAQELSDCIDKAGKVLYVKYRDYVIIAREDHVHVVKHIGRGIQQVSESEAKKVVEELSKLIS